MGTILASAIIADASVTLQDASNTRWTAAQMLNWLNAGQREIVIMTPEAYVENVAVQLAAGTKQSLPSGGLLLLEMARNMGTDGATPGRVPRLVDRNVIDAQNPKWHTDNASAVVMEYVYDKRDKGRFYVHPPQPTSNRGYVDLIYSKYPANIASTSTAITLDDIYSNALTNYILYRAYAKDPQSVAKAGDYYKLFTMLVIGKDSSDEKVRSKDDGKVE